jgi:hypothetical protein
MMEAAGTSVTLHFSNDHRLPENRKRLSCIGEPKNSPGVGVWNGQDALAEGDEQISGLLFDQALFDQFPTFLGKLHFRRERFRADLPVANSQIFAGEFRDLRPCSRASREAVALLLSYRRSGAWPWLQMQMILVKVT